MSETRAYDYRFIAACGLERRYIGPRPISLGVNQMAMQSGPQPPAKEWFSVEGKDFLSMTWKELEHVSHVIRDASHPNPPIKEEVKP